MNLNTLNEFRHEVYGCFGKARDALFNLVDALASETSARSFPELLFSPFFERTWASLYEALEDGQIDAERLRKIFVDFAPLPPPGETVFLGIDTSNLYRPEAETGSDRTLVPIANLPKNAHAASPGWVMSHVVLLPTQAGQGSYVLDTVRVRSTELATEVAARQLRAVVALLVARGLHPIILGDRWYACAPFLARTADVRGVGVAASQVQSRLLSPGTGACSWSDRSRSQRWGALSMQRRKQPWRSGCDLGRHRRQRSEDRGSVLEAPASAHRSLG